MLEFLKDLFYPEKKVCLACERRYDHSEIEGMCDRCLSRFSFINHFCPVCGREVIPASLIGDHPCPECQEKRPPYNFARSVFTYAGYPREILLEFKYGHRPDLAEPFAHMLRLYYLEYFSDRDIDYIIPVPMHADRKSYRGYNQTERLAEELAKIVKIEYKDVLNRIKNSLPLYTLAKEDRKTELEGAFQLKINRNPELFADKNILVVDDIITTGTTASEISHFILDELKAKNVYILTTSSVPVHVE
ncbi:MAG: ComF family protein [Halanaerobium sp. MSAO_Bac5]|nr:MAG: ComF family protein [Halanaerobium sp. MSAO_Bac5]